MTIRHYSSLDPGAPALSGSFYDRLRQVLMACLVTGYAGKPAAGWTVGHDVANGFSLGNGDGFVSWLKSGTLSYVGVWVMEAITDGSTAIPGGVNKRSAGHSDDSASSEKAYFYQSGGFGDGDSCWSVVADSKTVIVLGGRSGDGVDVAGYGGGFAHYFGAFVSSIGLEGVSTFCSLGTGLGNANTHGLGRPAYRYGNCLRNPETGLIPQGALPRYGASPAAHERAEGLTAVPVLRPSRLTPIRAALLYHGGSYSATTRGAAGIAGYLRGLISEPTLSGAKFSAVCNLLGLPATWQSRVKSFTLPNGQQWVPIYPSASESGFFVSLDPSDWE